MLIGWIRAKVKVKSERSLSLWVKTSYLKNGTDLGAHVKAAQEAEGRGGFIHEMSAALQKSSRVEYWLRLLRDGEFLDEKEFDSMNADNQELFSLLTTIVKTSRSRQ